jgi:hypothetical protein
MPLIARSLAPLDWKDFLFANVVMKGKSEFKLLCRL